LQKEVIILGRRLNINNMKNNWQKVKLGKVITVYKGKKVESFSGINLQGSKRFIQIDDLRNNNNLKYTNDHGIEVDKDDLIIAWDGANAGLIGYGLNGIIGSTLARLKIHWENIDTNYLGRYLQGQSKYLRSKSTGATIPHISKEVLTKLEIPLPSLEEQKRIVKVLDHADSLRQKRKQSIGLLDEYIKSIFLNMFGDPASNEKKWDKIPLSELLSKIESGRSPVCLNRHVEPGEWGVLKLGAITKCIYKPEENKALTDIETPNSSIEVKKGDVLFSRKNTYDLVAACAYVWETPPNLMLPDLIFRFVIKDKNALNPIYLQALLSFPSKRKIIQKLAGGAAGSMPNISKAKLIEQTIELPPIDLQNKFAEIVDKTESIKQKMLKQSGVLDTQFQSLMQKSFSSA